MSGFSGRMNGGFAGAPGGDLVAGLTGAQAPEEVYPPGSRYHGVSLAQMETASGRRVTYARRRFIPSPDELAVLHEHRVEAADRLDLLATRYFGDPEQFWRICDANLALVPRELMERLGRRLRITLPAGVPGPADE